MLNLLRKLLLLGLVGYAVASRLRAGAGRKAGFADTSPAGLPAIDRWEGEGGGVPVSDAHTAAQVPVHAADLSADTR